MSRSRVVRNAVIIIGFALVCIAGMEFLAINIGQPNPLAGATYTVNAVFADADGVPLDADVMMSGVVVGKVTGVSHDPQQPGYSVATLQLTDSHAVPVYSNGFAQVRPKTLLGEKYVDLTVGNPNTGEAIDSGGFLMSQQTATDVENDQIFNAFDQPTRDAQRQALQELDAATTGRAGDIQAIIPQLTQVVRNLDPVARVYEKDQPQSDQILVQLTTILQTLADEHSQVGSLLQNGDSVLGAIAARDSSLVRTLQEASNVATEINQAAAPTIASQRQALAEIGPSLAAQNQFFSLVVDPQTACGGRPCGIDEIFTGTLLGQINYPNDQLTVSSPTGEQVSAIWDSLFSAPPTRWEQPGSHSALNIVLSEHCDSVTQTLSPILQSIPNGLQTFDQVCGKAFPLGSGGSSGGPALPTLPGLP